MARPVCLLNTYIPENCGLKFGFQDPVFHLPLNDNYASPRIYDIRQIYNQTFIDPSGDPNSNAHSVAGHNGTAISFDGTDDQITITDEASQPYLVADSDFTLAIWAKNIATPLTANYHFLASCTGPQNGIVLAFNSDRYFIRFNVYTGGVSYTTYYLSAPSIDTNWHHYAITRFGYTITCYFDGTAVATSTQAQNALIAYTPGTPLYLGRNTAGTLFASCALEDLRLYTRALTQSEITSLAA